MKRTTIGKQYAMANSNDQDCPCGSGDPLAQCCGPYLASTAFPSTAEDLMRSRYTAFVLADHAYVASSWDSTTRPDDASAPSGIDWRRLRIRNVVAGGVDDATGEVEFMAYYRTAQGNRDVLHERSRFRRENGRWVYFAGELF